MTSLEDMAVYGSGYNIKKRTELKNPNPHRLKLHDIPENEMCPWCDTIKEHVFPMTDLALCPECWAEVSERQECKMVIKPYVYKNISRPPLFCTRCGKDMTQGWLVNTHICEQCVAKAGKFEDAWKARWYNKKGKGKAMSDYFGKR